MNANTANSQFPGIDAMDEVNGISLQITSDTTVKKVTHSLKIANEHQLYLTGPNFKMGYLSEKKKFSKASEENIKNKIGDFLFSPNEDYYTFDRIYRELYDSKDMVKMRKSITVLDKYICLLYTSPSPRDQRGSRMPSSA